jgi:hypothetical protein
VTNGFIDDRRLPDELLKKMALHLAPLVIYRDYRDEMPPKGVELVCEKGRDGYWEWQDDLYEDLCDHVWQVETDAAKQALDDFDDELKDWIISIDPKQDRDDPELLEQNCITPSWIRSQLIDYDGLNVEIESEGYLSNHNGYLALELKGLEHPYQGWRSMIDGYYPDIAATLTAFKINPRKVALAYDLPLTGWPNYARTRPDEGELVKAEDLFTSWDNWPYGGGYYVMLERSALSEIAKIPDMDDLPRLMIKKGGRIIGHDYLNGASALDFELQKDWLLPTGLVGGFFDDGQNNYGIQSCCGYVLSAWESELEIVWPPVAEMQRRWYVSEV